MPFLENGGLSLDSKRMGQPAKPYEYYSWNDYRSWSDDERWELIDGYPYAMTPSPRFRHQDISAAITAELRAFLTGRPCRAVAAPMDVRLSDADVVQPDVLVVCDPDKIKETHIEGAPDIAVEITSPSSISHDRMRKLALYAKYGVKEYWIVTPYPHLVEVLLLDGDSYRVHSVFTKRDTLSSPTLSGLEIPLDGVFNFPIPDNERIDEIRESTPPYGHARRPAD